MGSQEQHYRRELGAGLSVRLAQASSAAEHDIAPAGVDARRPLPPFVEPDRVRLTRLRQPQDTPAGCREKAAADLARAAAGTAGQQSWLYEHSAASWAERANLLERQAAALDARKQGRA
jgi:hypothetical protein